MPIAEPQTIPLLRSHLQLQNILLLVDLDQHSHVTLSHALRIQKLRESRIIACHLLSPAEGSFVPDDPTRRIPDLERRQSEMELRDLELHTRLKEVAHSLVLENGTFGEVIPKLAAEYEIDLVVMGSHRHSRTAKLLFGSICEAVVRETPLPVLTVGPRLTTLAAATPFRRILLATDFDEASQHAASYALSLAMDAGGCVNLLHVVESPEQLAGHPQQKLAEIRGKLKRLVPEDAELFCSPQVIVEYGPAAQRILETAERENSDLIVMGVHRPKFPALASHALHDVAYDVISQATCPVLTLNH
jgi:nucleotide-binding universal stress UspA family protein